jgi:hypothetical protein
MMQKPSGRQEKMMDFAMEFSSRGTRYSSDSLFRK